MFLDTVHCVAIDNNALVYVCDRKGDRIEVFETKDGNCNKNIVIERALDTSATHPVIPGGGWDSPATPKYMYVADGERGCLDRRS